MSRGFWKWQGLGNDFMLLSQPDWPQALSEQQVRRLADRHRGVGFDQLLLVDPQERSFRVRNADGSHAQQCGNGLRCVAAWLLQEGFVDRDIFRLKSPAGQHEVQVHPDDTVSASMGWPRLGAPLALDFQGREVVVQPVDFGNPHAVVRVANVQHLDLAALAAAVSALAAFPDGVNVGALQVSQPSRAELRVYERGSGATFACGSGACAAMAVGRQQGWVDEQVVISQPGGELQMRWQGENDELWMRGPARFIYRGELDPKSFFE